MRRFGVVATATALASTFVISNVFAEDVVEPSKHKVHRIVLTGGPCGGKSSALAALDLALTERGFKVYSVPEVPTIMLTAGAEYLGVEGKQLLVTETAFLKLQLAIEDCIIEIASNQPKPAVVICDRGALDISAYVGDLWDLILADAGVSNVELLGRYDSVIHLVTAARGAEKFYTLGNNAARTESIEQARQLDAMVLTSWVGHERLVIVDNSTGFKGKLEKIVDSVLNEIGVVDHNVRTFRVKGTVPSSVVSNDFTLSTFSLSDGSSLVVRGQDGSYSYQHRGKGGTKGRILSVREFAHLREQATGAPVKQTVKTWSDGSSYFVLEHDPSESDDVLRVYSSVPGETDSLVPKFFATDRKRKD